VHPVVIQIFHRIVAQLTNNQLTENRSIMEILLDDISRQILEFICRREPVDRDPPVFLRREDIAGELRLSLREYDEACGQLSRYRLIFTDQPASSDVDFIAPTRAGRLLGTPRPLPVAFWVEPGRLLAGEYPGALDPEEARIKLRRMLKAGITFFVDLTSEWDGLELYRPLLYEEAARMRQPVEHRRMAIQDGGVPKSEWMRKILDTIDRALDQGHRVYVHCWGGVGRTGTVIGCYLVRHGATGKEALAELKRMRGVLPEGECNLRVPETIEQDQYILNWQVGL
jgi:protein-tyrosine phosphatase